MPRGFNVRTGAMRTPGQLATLSFYRNGHAWQATVVGDKQCFVCTGCGKTFDARNTEPCTSPTISGTPPTTR